MINKPLHYKRKTRGLIITYRCNLDCVYCYVHEKSNRNMSIDMAKKVIEEAFKDTEEFTFEELELDFMGAEPLCEFKKIKELSEWIWSKTWEKPYILYATTNGTLLNDDMRDWFTQHRNQIVLGLSYDGTGEMQDKSRSSSSRFVDMDFFHNNWPLQPIKMTISEENVAGLTEGIIYLHQKGFDINASPANGMPVWSKENVNEYGRQLSILADYYYNHPEIKRSSLLNLDLLAIFKTQGLGENKYCGAATGFDVVDVDGEIYPCHMFSPLVVSKQKAEIAQTIDFLSKELFEYDKCQKCFLNRICPTCCGMNYNLRGNLAVRDDNLCKLFRLQFVANCKLWMRRLKDNRKIDHNELKLFALLKKALSKENKIWG